LKPAIFTEFIIERKFVMFYMRNGTVSFNSEKVTPAMCRSQSPMVNSAE